MFPKHPGARTGPRGAVPCVNRRDHSRMRESAVPAAVSPHAAPVRLCRILFPLFAAIPRRPAAVLVLAAVLLWPGQVLAADQTVTSVDDSGAGSLRQALADVAANDSVFFDISGSPATITLASGLSLSVDGVSLLAQPGGNVTVSLSGASNVTALTSTSLGTLGGASGLAIEATGTGSNVTAISSASTLTIDAVGATASLTATAVEDNVYGIRAVGNMTIGHFAGSVTASSTVWTGIGAYGLVSDTGSVTIGAIAETGRIRAEVASWGSYAVSGATGVTITGELAGDIEAVSGLGYLTGSDAYGIYSSGGAVSIGAIAETGSITAWGEGSSAYGIWASGDVAMGSMAGDISATSELGPSVYGILSANGSITIASIAETGSISSLAGASFTGAVFAATGDVEITGAMAGRLSATSTADAGGGTHVFGITAYNGALSIGSIAATGFVNVLAARDKAYALYGDDGVTIGGDMAGILLAEATTGGEAYGVLSEGGSVSIGAITQTGQIVAMAGTNDAYGIRAFDNVVITDQMAGNIFATATGGDNACGIASDFGDVTIGDMGGAADHWASVIAMAGGDTAVGIGSELGSVTIASLGQYSQVMAVAGGMTAFGIQAGDTLTITGDLSGIVVAAAGNMAAGLTAGTVNIGSVSQTGWILSHAGDDAYGILAACDVSIAGGMAGIISAVADGNTAVGIMAFQELNGGDPATALAISGTVSAQAAGLAVGVASGEAMNLYVTGTLSGVDTTGGGQGYAIRAGVADGFGGWIVGSADNTVTLGTGAQLVGKVDLGTGGDNSLNLMGLGAADNLFLGVDHLTVGDGSTATSWNLSLSSDNASTVDDLAVNAQASLRVNENVTITGNIANDGTFISDLGANRTYGGVISGAGTLVKDGAATLTLSGANTYTGATVISGGTLRLGAADALSDRTVVSLADVAGAAFDIRGYDVTVAGLIGGGRNGGNVRLGSGTLTVANADDNLFAGVISGTGGLTKSGAGMLALTGNNTYTGDTSVTAGTLLVTGSLASQSVEVAAGALFDMSPVADTTYAGVISGAGDFQKSGAGILTLSGDSTYTGATTLASGILRITGSLASQNIDMAAGTLLDMSPSMDTTYAGVIEGAGTFLKSGDATLTLSGDSTYTGATVISGGTLRLGAADALSDRTVVSLADVAGAAFDIRGYDVTVAGLIGGGRNGGNVRLGSGTLTVANADDNLFAGVISGTGGLTKSGAGMLALTGNNTYTGDTSVTAGTLLVTGSLASQSVEVAAGALFDMSPVADTTYAGVISGAGDFQKSGAGILTLSGDSTYTGATTLASGMLRITGSLASQNIDMAAGTLLDMSPSVDTTYAGVIEGAGTFLKSGDATLTLSGDSTYTGATWVTAGLLDVTGSLASPDYQIDAGAGIAFARDHTLTGGAVVNGTWTSPLLTVGSTGTLMGTGTIIGDVESHGTIAPGLSPGTLTIDGDLLLGSGSLLSLEITPTASDLLHVTGATTIDGGSLHVDIASGYYTSGQQFTLLSSDGGLSGDYETITIDNQSSFLVFSVENTDTATVGAFGGDVTVTRLPYAIAATTRNAYGASLGLTGATSLATPAMQSILAEIDFMSLGEVAQGLKQMSPEPYSALVETSFSAMRLFSDTIRERTYTARGGGESILAMLPGGEMSRMTELASRSIASDAPSGITATSGQAGARGLFVKPVGQYVGFDKGHNRTGFNAWQYGVVAGGDLAVNDTLLAGFQVGYVHSDLSFSDTAKSNGRSDTFLGGLYASYASGGFYADGLVQAGAAWNRLVRKIEFGSIATRPEGTYVSFLFGGSLTTGYDWTFGKFKAGPVATLDYGYVSVPGFAETGDAELGLTVRGFSGNSLKTGLGAKVSGTFTVGETTTVSPDVSLRWGHEFLNDSQNIKARFNGSPTSSFSAKTGDPARDSLLVDAGVSMGMSDSTKLYLRYSGQLFGQGSRSQAGAVGVRYEF